MKWKRRIFNVAYKMHMYRLAKYILPTLYASYRLRDGMAIVNENAELVIDSVNEIRGAIRQLSEYLVEIKSVANESKNMFKNVYNDISDIEDIYK